MTPLLVPSEVAQILRISRSQAYRLMQTGEIPTVRIQSSVRVRMEDLLAYIAANHSSRSGSDN